MTKGEYLLKEFLWDVYKEDSRIILGMIQKHLSVKEQTALRWHVTVVTPQNVLVLTDAPETLKQIVVLGTGGQKIIFKAVSRAK